MQVTADKEESDHEDGLSALLTPSRMAEVHSARSLAPADVGGSSPSGQLADAAGRSGGVTTTSHASDRPQLPPELAEPPPGEVNDELQVSTNHRETSSIL